MRLWFHVVFVLFLFVPHLSFFRASGRLCFVNVAFPGYLDLHFRGRTNRGYVCGFLRFWFQIATERFLLFLIVIVILCVSL